MEQVEFLSWVEFFKLFPFDDLHRYHRPHALTYAAAFSPADRQQAVEGALEWLAPDRSQAALSGADMNTMRAFGFTKKGD